MTRQKEHAKLEEKLDDIFSRFVRERDGWQCQRCRRFYRHAPGGLDCAHIFTRSRHNTRWLSKNAIALCKGCHKFWAHKYPDQFRDWNIERMGEVEYTALRYRSEMRGGHSNEELKLFLRIAATIKGQKQLFN